MTTSPTTTQEHIMNAIDSGEIKMRPRWYFTVQTVILGGGMLFIVGVVVYTVSLAIFVTEQSGVYLAPRYGVAGWLLLLRSIPWVLILASITLIITLESLMRRYTIVYARPLVYSFLALMIVLGISGTIVAQTSLHEILARSMRTYQVPLFRAWYDRFDPDHVPGTYRGRIQTLSSNQFILQNRYGETTTIMITTDTRLPPMQLRETDRVVVIGTRGTSTVSAWGVHILEVPPRH